MKRWLGIAALGVGLTIAPVRAEACRIPRPRLPGAPVVAYLENSRALVIARVVGEDESRDAVLRVDETIYGRAGPSPLTLRRGEAPHDGEIVIGGCDPVIPWVPNGALVLATLETVRDGGQVVSRWTRLTDATRRDPFLVRYLATRSRAARRRMGARWGEVSRFGGPIPLSDPKRWLAPAAGGLFRTETGDTTWVAFDVRGDGRIANCRVTWPRVPAARDRAVCATLARRGRFQPPQLAEERQGAYQVRWNAAP